MHLSYRWLEGPHGATLEEGFRSPLPRALPPGEAGEGPLTVRTPLVRGNYMLRLTLVQEVVSWFDEVTADNGLTSPIEVKPHR